ncbi:unnamed protein product, partial [Staurois parvus]
CQVQSLSWVPVRPPIAAVSIATLCHVPLSGLLTHCWCVEFFDIGCWDYGPPIAAARPLICHGPLYTASSCCCQVQSLSWVPVRPPIAAVSIATLCHVPLSGLLTHCWCPESLMGPCTASHCCCLHRHTLPCATFRSPH